MVNDANIVKLGPLGGQYVAGEQYSEAVLVQTNIIAQSADIVPAQSSATPVVDAGAAPGAEAAVSPPTDHQSSTPQTDMTAHVLSDPLHSVLS